MKRVIINGDDFGMNERCSAAIAQALREERITDTTMIANGACFEKAVLLAGKEGFLDRIGIHFNLTEGIPLTDGIRSIPDFVCGGAFCKAYVRDPRPLSEEEQNAVYAELTAQADRVVNAGICITHADSHHYIHNIPYLAPIIARVCREHGIGKIRLQRTYGDADGAGEDRRFWREQGFITTDHFGRTSDIADGEIPDLLEIMVHPDYDKDGMLIDRRGVENGFPVGEKLCRIGEEQGVVLIGYHDLTLTGR